MITYLTFTTQYPLFTSIPYTVADVTEKLEEVSILFPAINSCLPENVRLLATKYGVLYLYNQDEAGCYGGKSVVEIKNMNSTIRYNVASGKPFSLENDTYGRRLLQMFHQHGCNLAIGPGIRQNCKRCGCSGGCSGLSKYGCSGGCSGSSKCGCHGL